MTTRISTMYLLQGFQLVICGVLHLYFAPTYLRGSIQGFLAGIIAGMWLTFLALEWPSQEERSK